jgi:NAD(P)-dependent dehydrogenase (short-subunit alcohol dehydrogenase family)
MDLFDLTGKTAVVTGGTRGIGLMIARGLLQAGASVYLSSRKPEAGEAAVAELSAHGRVVSVPADLAREEECVRLAAEVGRAEGRVHVLVNNAGATGRSTSTSRRRSISPGRSCRCSRRRQPPTTPPG